MTEQSPTTYGRVQIQDDASGLTFVWNEAHTVNVYSGDENIDVMSIGDFAQDAATFEDFKRSVASYLEEPTPDLLDPEGSGYVAEPPWDES